MRRWLSLLLIGLLAYGAFLVVGWPARHLIERVPDVQADLVEGSLIRGEARQLRIQDAQLDRLSWQLAPKALAGGRLAWQLMLSNGGDHLSTVFGLDWQQQLHLDQTRGQLPLTTLTELAGRPLPFLSGRLLLDMRQLSLDRTGLPRRIDGIAQLLDARLPSGAPLGTLQAEFHTNSDAITGRLRDTGGPLLLDATLELTPDGRYRLSGELGARDNAEPSLHQTLNLLGQPAPGGRRQFNLTGRLAEP